jgi:hypothetical protein
LIHAPFVSVCLLLFLFFSFFRCMCRHCHGHCHYHYHSTTTPLPLSLPTAPTHCPYLLDCHCPYSILLPLTNRCGGRRQQWLYVHRHWLGLVRTGRYCLRDRGHWRQVTHPINIYQYNTPCQYIDQSDNNTPCQYISGTHPVNTSVTHPINTKLLYERALSGEL